MTLYVSREHIIIETNENKYAYRERFPSKMIIIHLGGNANAFLPNCDMFMLCYCVLTLPIHFFISYFRALKFEILWFHRLQQGNLPFELIHI